MIRRNPLIPLAKVAATPLVALALISCSSDDSSGADAPSAATGATGQPAVPGLGTSGTVDLASTDLGTIVVDAKGMTLYLFQADSGTTSACNDVCAKEWPPLQSDGQPTAGDGIDRSLLGTTQRTDGSAQVTFNGHPVYTFAADSKPGDTSGEGVNAFGGLWYVLSANGDQIASGTPTSGY